MLRIHTDTRLQGWEKRELSDPLSPIQLWIISEVADGMYTIQNTSSRTFADIPSSMSMNHLPRASE